MANMTAGESFEQLVEVIRHLRAPDGCPWDREQTLQTLKTYVVEEAYEVVQAVEKGIPEEHCEELGDLIMQVVFQARIAEEEGRFSIADVSTRQAEKLKSRHPHVFGAEKVQNSAEVLVRWEAQKLKEGRGVLSGLPASLPALMMALRMSEKVGHVGFDWPDAKSVVAKLDEEIAELKQAMDGNDPERVEQELGDVLFTLANLARKSHINPEEALRKMLMRFKARFDHIESRLAEEGRSVAETPLPALDVLWEEAKQLQAAKQG